MKVRGKKLTRKQKEALSAQGWDFRLLTSRQELNAQWKAKIAALGLTFDTAAAQYKPAEEAQ